MSKDDLRSLADRYFRLKEFQKESEEAIQELRAKLIAANRGVIVGDEAKVTIVQATRRWLDSDLVRTFLTPKQIKDCTKKKDLTVVKVASLRKKDARYPDNG